MKKKHQELYLLSQKNKGDLIFDKKNFRWRYRLRLCWVANVTFTFSKKLIVMDLI